MFNLTLKYKKKIICLHFNHTLINPPCYSQLWPKEGPRWTKSVASLKTKKDLLLISSRASFNMLVFEK